MRSLGTYQKSRIFVDHRLVPGDLLYRIGDVVGIVPLGVVLRHCPGSFAAIQ